MGIVEELVEIWPNEVCDTCIQKQSLLQNSYTCIPLQSSLAIIQYLYSCFIIYHYSHLLSIHRKNNNIYQKRKLQSSSADRVHDWRETTTFLFYTLYSIFLFLPSDFSLFLCSVCLLLLLLSLLSTSQYFCLFSLRLWP